jgi:hypothetical protein
VIGAHTFLLFGVLLYVIVWWSPDRYHDRRSGIWPTAPSIIWHFFRRRQGPILALPVAGQFWAFLSAISSALIIVLPVTPPHLAQLIEAGAQVAGMIVLAVTMVVTWLLDRR